MMGLNGVGCDPIILVMGIARKGRNSLQYICGKSSHEQCIFDGNDAWLREARQSMNSGLMDCFTSFAMTTVHVHGKCQGRESRAEIIMVAGVVEEIRYSDVAGRASLDHNEHRFFQEIVTAKADEIVSKWIDYFVLHKSVASERITKRLK